MLIAPDLATQALYSRAYDTPDGECLCGRPDSEDSARLTLDVTRADGATRTVTLAICPDCGPTVMRMLNGEAIDVLSDDDAD